MLLAVLLLAVGAGGSLFFSRGDADPNAEAGRAWLDGFTTLLTSPGLLGARGPGALALFPQLGKWASTGC